MKIDRPIDTNLLSEFILRVIQDYRIHSLGLDDDTDRKRLEQIMTQHASELAKEKV